MSGWRDLVCFLVGHKWFRPYGERHDYCRRCGESRRAFNARRHADYHAGAA